MRRPLNHGGTTSNTGIRFHRNIQATSGNGRGSTCRLVSLFSIAFVMVAFMQLGSIRYKISSASWPVSTMSDSLFSLLTSDDGAGFPHTCSADQLTTITYQLPEESCIEAKEWPWGLGGRCSFSFATRCPESVWLEDFIRKRHQVRAALHTTDGDDDKSRDQSFISFYIGCNKGMDAINTLRMGSANTTIDKETWRLALFAGHETTEIAAGHCAQEFAHQFSVPARTPTIGDAIVHCVEPLPRNSARLQATAKKLGYEDHFHVHAVAMSNEDGITYFPRETKLGDEQKGIGSCELDTSNCDAVPMYTLDTFSRDVLQDEASMIDFLSIDVEGYDGLVLEGASKMLSRVRYLEFEYNWKGPWKKISLSSTIQTLKEAGFSCYWPGAHGNIWRITDCFLSHYDLKFWSNVACVNVQDPSTKDLAQVMERMFHETLEQGHAIRYDTIETATTNGKKPNPTIVAKH
jgi:FkbM family methyltransferase